MTATKNFRKFSVKHCQHVLNNEVTVTPSTVTIVDKLGTLNLIPKMNHVIGFNGTTFTHITNVTDEVLRKNCFLIVRPFYYKSRVNIYIHTPTGYKWFGVTKQKSIALNQNFEKLVAQIDSKLINWQTEIVNTGIFGLGIPKDNTLPTFRKILNTFSGLVQTETDVNNFTIDFLDGMTRSTAANIYINCLDNLLQFQVSIEDSKITFAPKAEVNSSVVFSIEHITEGFDHLVKHEGSYDSIAGTIKTIRGRAKQSELLFDAILAKTILNAIVVISYENYELYICTLDKTPTDCSGEAYFVADDGKHAMKVNFTFTYSKQV